MYDKVSPQLNFTAHEAETQKFWKEHRIFQKTIDSHRADPPFTFYDGPPTANGKPHIGHVLTRVVKDLIPRFRTMKGFEVLRKAGWDTHGLPVELEVERALGLDGKEQVEQYGLAPFIDACKKSVWKYKEMWEDFSDRVAFWLDMEHPYVTYENDYIESEWWALRQIWDKGLLYKGFKIVPYCPRCGTPLSSHEVAQGYKTVKERSAIVRFRCADEDAFFLAWTTTPWTLPSNVALCVHPDLTYVRVKAADGNVYYLAEALCDSVLGCLATENTPAYTVLERIPGRALEHRAYLPLYACAAEAAAKQNKPAHFVTCDGYVTTSDGTGIVHIAPAFGEDDSRIGRIYDLPFVQFVDGHGNMTAETPYAGLFVKQADPRILADLERDGKLFAAPSFEHDYPHCWRCGTPLIYYARDSWFIRMTAVRDNLIRNNNTVNWIPASIGRGRFGDWLENIQDWGVSRNRYWGTPLNIWECACGERHAVGSIAELRRLSENCPENIELHRPYIDAVTIRCPKCGGVMKRVPEVIDCWFDSGAMPFAQWHYPFENQDKFHRYFPADFISEGVDQTRGWFYSLMAISTLLFDCAPYKSVLVLGHVLDKDGQKMSKSRGNAVDPMEALAEFGADAIRWYFYTNSAPWLPNRFYREAVTEGQRKFLGTLWNTYAFFVLYANIDGFCSSAYTLDRASLSVMDRFMLSRLHSVIREVDADLTDIRIPEAAHALADLVDELSNWYVRRSRERFWGKEMTQDKINAYMTLHTCLVTIAKLAAPMIPFMAEEIYRNLVCHDDPTAPESVHLCAYPVADPTLIDPDLEERMEEALRIVVLGRACRASASMKNRQPIARMFVKAPFTLPDYFCDIIRDELNVHELLFSDSVRDYTTYTFKPQLKTVGPKFGKQVGAIRSALAAIDGNAAMDALDSTGVLSLTLPDGGSVQLSREDLLIEMTQRPGYVSLSENGITVVLDTNLTEDLLEEGFVNELVSKLQNMRKDSGFEVTDRIVVGVDGNDKIEGILRRHEAEIAAQVLAVSVEYGNAEGGRDWNLNGENVRLSVRRV